VVCNLLLVICLKVMGQGLLPISHAQFPIPHYAFTFFSLVVENSRLVYGVIPVGIPVVSGHWLLDAAGENFATTP
jgi:hypothetical protein